MEKEATINSLFGETIYYTYIENNNEETAKNVESFVKEKPGRTAATTDVKGNTMFTDLEEARDNLHKDSKYKELYKNIGTNILSSSVKGLPILGGLDWHEHPSTCFLWSLSTANKRSW